MKNEIIYTEDYALILSDEHIKDVRPHKGKYHLEDGLTINKFPDYLTDLGACKLIIAHRPLTDAPILEGVPLLPEFTQEEDMLEVAKNYLLEQGFPGHADHSLAKKWMVEFYNKAKEKYAQLIEKQISDFTHDLKESTSNHIKQNCEGALFGLNRLKQSLQQPKRPKYFECEMEPKYKHIGAVKGIYGSGFRKQNLMYGLPKTITNSQGQKELVGSYIY